MSVHRWVLAWCSSPALLLFLSSFIVCFFWTGLSRTALHTDLFTATFLGSCATCSTLLGPALCSGTIACQVLTERGRGSLFHVAGVHPDFCHLPLGLVWLWERTLSVPAHTHQNWPCWAFDGLWHLLKFVWVLCQNILVPVYSGWEERNWINVVSCFLRLYCIL